MTKTIYPRSGKTRTPPSTLEFRGVAGVSVEQALSVKNNKGRGSVEGLAPHVVREVRDEWSKVGEENIATKQAQQRNGSMVFGQRKCAFRLKEFQSKRDDPSLPVLSL